MTTQTLRNGDGKDLAMQPGETMLVVAVTGSYSASIIAGTGAPSVIATNATGGSYGPYAKGAVVRLRSSALSEIDFDIGTAPVVASDTPVMASKTFTGGIELSAGGNVLDGVLFPSGGDDTAALEAWVNHCATAGRPAILGAGGFIVTGPMVWRSKKVMAKWGNKGIGLKVFGQGAGNTEIYYSGSSSLPMITVDCPDEANIGKRNYFTEIGEMSWLRATSGKIEIAAGLKSGKAFYGVPKTAGEVLHTTRFKNLVVDGFDEGFTLSDSTLCEFDTVWFPSFRRAIICGFNIDMLRIRHSMFGSEQAALDNDAIAVSDGFNDGHNAAGGNDHFHVESTWFMKIGTAFKFDTQTSLVIGRGTYFENLRQIVNTEDLTGTFTMEIAGSHLSVNASNDDAAFPKFSFGANSALYLTVGPAVTGGAYSPLGGWFALRSNSTFVTWLGNNIIASGVGLSTHLRSARTGEAHTRTPLPNKGAGVYSFAGGTGMSKKSGPEIPFTVAATTGTLTPAHTDGDAIAIGPMSGNITIHPASNTPVNPDDGTIMTYVIQANATTPASFTVTWGTNFALPTAFVQPGAGDASKKTMLTFRRQNSRWHQIGSGNAWIL